MTFRDLYPTLSPAELEEAEYRFRRYLEIAWEVANEAAQNHAVEDRVEEE